MNPNENPNEVSSNSTPANKDNQKTNGRENVKMTLLAIVVATAVFVFIMNKSYNISNDLAVNDVRYKSFVLHNIVEKVSCESMNSTGEITDEFLAHYPLPDEFQKEFQQGVQAVVTGYSSVIHQDVKIVAANPKYSGDKPKIVSSYGGTVYTAKKTSEIRLFSENGKITIHFKDLPEALCKDATYAVCDGVS